MSLGRSRVARIVNSQYMNKTRVLSICQVSYITAGASMHLWLLNSRNVIHKIKSTLYNCEVDCSMTLTYDVLHVLNYVKRCDKLKVIVEKTNVLYFGTFLYNFLASLTDFVGIICLSFQIKFNLQYLQRCKVDGDGLMGHRQSHAVYNIILDFQS